MNIYGLTQSELKEQLNDEKSFRVGQIYSWLYKKHCGSFEEMTNLSKDLRVKLESQFSMDLPEIVTSQLSSDGTRKFLFRLNQGLKNNPSEEVKVETVLIKQPKRYTLCISSQYGCAIGCKFCRTATMGLKRNLEVHEIIGQVVAVQREINRLVNDDSVIDKPAQFHNIVFMGMGEPLHNFENVNKAIQILNDTAGSDFSGRRITLSTSGLVPQIAKFGDSPAKANLAISLNATTNEVREEIMPITKKYPLEDLLGVLKDFPLKKREKITLEYVMLRGVNDTEADLKRLPKLIKNIPAKINLIPYNTNSGLGFQSPERVVVDRWLRDLLSKKIVATVRWSKGMDIDAACGQLVTAEKTKMIRSSEEINQVV